MSRAHNWLVSASLVLALVFGFSTLAKAADEKGSVTVTVTGKDGKPAADVEVGLLKPAAKAAASAPGFDPFGAITLAKGARGEAVAQGTTDKEGKCTLKDVPVGDYQVVARNRTDKTIGRSKVTIIAGATAMVSVELKEQKRNAK